MRLLMIVVLFIFSLPLLAANIVVDVADADLNNNGNCSLREALLAAFFDLQFDQCTQGSGADEITFDASLFNGLGELFIVLNDTLLAGGSEDITITVDDTKTLFLVGDGTFPHLSIRQEKSPSIEFHINNTQFLMGFSANPGGSIQFDGKTTLAEFNHVSFINNESLSAGGAISTENGPNVGLLFNDVTFFNNMAPNGGAIDHFNGQALEINNSSFDSNEAGSFGGAIYFKDSNLLKISNSRFNNNHADTAGVIFATNLNTKVFSQTKIYSSSFINNGGTGGESVISSSEIEFTINNSLFAENHTDSTHSAIKLINSDPRAFIASRLTGNSFYKNVSEFIARSKDSADSIGANYPKHLNVQFGKGSILRGNVFVDQSPLSSQRCTFLLPENTLSQHNAADSSDCLLGNDNQILANDFFLHYVDVAHPVHQKILSPSINSPLVDAWLKADCLDDMGFPLIHDLTGLRLIGGEPFDGDNNGINDCDIGATELGDLIFQSGFEQ